MLSLILAALRATAGLAGLVVLTGCGALPLNKAASSWQPVGAASSDAEAAVAIEAIGHRASADPVDDEAAGDFKTTAAGRIAATATCGLKGAVQPLRMLLVPVLGMIAIPMVPVGAMVGAVEGAFQGWCY
jgi:hypothetical protein